MAQRIQFRRDLAATWTSVNPTMMEGELGLETDTGLFKVGNGVSAWVDLAYSSGPAGPAGADGAQGPQGDPTTVNGHTGSSITLTASDVGAIPVVEKGEPLGVATLDASGLLESAQVRPVRYLGESAGVPAGLKYGEVYYDTVDGVNYMYLLDGTPEVPEPILVAIDGWLPLLNQPNGIASLDADGNIPIGELPAGQPNGLATLDADGRVPNSQLPPLAITDTFVVANETEMLALAAEVGDIAVRTDLTKSFILKALPASDLANWQELLAPPNAVLSVDGRTGAVSLSDLYDANGAASSAISAHLAATDPHGDRAYTDGEISNLTNGVTTFNELQFNLTAGATSGVGQLNWNATDGTLDLGMVGGNVVLQVGEELLVRVLNRTGSTILNGAAVYLNGSQGNRPTIALAQADLASTSNTTIGIATEDIANNGMGFVTLSGIVRDINTAALTEGADIYLSATVAGGLTSTMPSAPNHATRIGVCVRQHATVGQIFVAVQNGTAFAELSDLVISSPTDKQPIAYDSASGTWKNQAIAKTGVTGTAITQADTGTVTNTLIADGAVTSAKIADGTIVDADISASANIAASKLYQSLGLSVLGRPANTGGSTTSIQAAADGDVLRRSGTTLGFGQITTAGISDGAVTSAKIADGTIVNADISGSAAISPSKIQGTAITAADNGTVTSAMILNGTIQDADISASAAISLSKLALPSANTGDVLTYAGVGTGWTAAPGVSNFGMASTLPSPYAMNATTTLTANNTLYARVSIGNPSISKIGFYAGTIAGTPTIYLSAYSNTGSGRTAAPSVQYLSMSTTLSSANSNSFVELILPGNFTVNAGDWFALSTNGLISYYGMQGLGNAYQHAGYFGGQASAVPPSPATINYSLGGTIAPMIVAY